MTPQLELSIEKSGFNTEEGEIIIALLMNAGFESFEEDESYIRAYCSENLFDQNLKYFLDSFPGIGKHPLKYSSRKIGEKNWNEIWEKNFSPISVGDRILIKAPFHDNPDLEFTILIEPKMSFGTGHHETTRLMLREMLRLEISGKEVLDMGCGTGILGIAAKMMGASYVLAVDNDQWAYYNSGENFERNNIEQPFDVYPGDSSALEGHTFHIILANINRNVLLNDLPVYFNCLKKHGILVLSGIHESDSNVLLAKAKECGFTFSSSFYENNWISLNLKK
jgi:ribosomal protein L11 methyltransferase